jgi:hypothetical protein
MDLEAGALINEFLRDAKDARQANILVEVGPPTAVPNAVICQFRRSAAVAPRSRGNRSSDTLISRPSSRGA